MNIVAGILFIIIAVAFFISAIISESYGEEVLPMLQFGTVVLSIFIFIAALNLFGIFSTPKKPTALDVYRGNTTLSITYTDSIPTDTVVIFKSK